MSRYLFFTWNGAGNQPPTVGLAQELRLRGHDVVFAGNASQRARFEKHGFRFAALEGSDEAAVKARRDGDMDRFGVSAILWCTPQLREVPELFTGENADALVVDCMMFAALAAAEVAGLPAAVLVHSAPGALFRPNAAMGDQFVPELNALRTALGLTSVDRAWDAWREMPVIVTSIRQLDPPVEEVPASFHYVGPIFEQLPVATERFPLTDGDDRPVVLVSFSTSPGDLQGQRSRLERTLTALASTPCRVLATVSDVDMRGLDVPHNAILVRHLPHSQILPQVAVTVTHAGHGTTIASLTHGVPLVCLPQPTRPPDQAVLAARVQALGAGRALDGDEATPADIAAAVQDAMTEPSYRERAAALADFIRTMPGSAGAATIVEGL